MKFIFGRGPSLSLRLFFTVMLSAGLMLADSRIESFTKIRYLLTTAVAPLQYTANLPRAMMNDLYERFQTQSKLVEENSLLKKEMKSLKSDLLLLNQSEVKIRRLSALLGSPYARDERKKITEVMAVDSSPYLHQMVIDKGHTDDVYEGQPIINDKGVVGIVTNVAGHNSRILLLTDSRNAIPVQILRNDLRVIAVGTGDSDYMELENVPTNTDIKVGDLIITSGLGAQYPEGYPVGNVVSVNNDNRKPFATIKIKPVVDFKRLRYLLLVWPDKTRLNQAKLVDKEGREITSEPKVIQAEDPDTSSDVSDADVTSNPDNQSTEGDTTAQEEANNE